MDYMNYLYEHLDLLMYLRYHPKWYKILYYEPSYFKDFLKSFLITCMYVFTCVCTHKYRCLQPPGSLDSPGAWLTYKRV